MTHGTNAGRTKAVEAAKAVGGKPYSLPSHLERLFTPTRCQQSPQAYRKHTQAAGELKALISQDGPSAGDPAQSERAAWSEGRNVSRMRRFAALDKMKRLTDFNDLATKSSLEREGLNAK